MAIEENITAVHRYWEGFNTHNLNIWDEVCTPDHMNHDPALPTPHADLQTIKQTISAIFFSALPDLTSSEDDLIATGEKVVVRRTFRGTHTGELMGVAPTGKAVTFTGIFIDRLVGGKIAEQWVVFDALSLLQQTGVVSAPGQGAR
jgi:predicted ester cyclase